MKIESIKELIINLNKKEIKLIKYILKFKNSIINNNKIKLLNYIYEGNTCNKELIISGLFKNKLTPSSYSNLINSLLVDLLNIILILDTEKIVRSKNFASSLDLKKCLTYSELLYRKGHTDLGNYFINKGIEIATEYELPMEALILNELKRVRFGASGNKKEIESLAFISEKLLKNASSLVKSLSLYNEFSGLNKNQFNLSKDILEKGFQNTKELEKIYNKVPLAKNGYWYYRSAIFYYLRNENYSKIELFSKKLLELTKKNKSIYTPVNIAGINLEISEIYLLSKKYEESIESLNISLSLFNPKLNNYLTALGSLFLANFHSDQMKECWRIIDQAVAHPKYTEKKENATVWNYYKVCILFKEGKFSEALKIYNQIAGNLSSSKDELYIYSKLLFLYIQFETNKSVLWSYEIASFRKIIPTIKNVTLDRFKIIFQLLHHLDKNEFDFPYVEAVESDRIQKLQENNFQWKPLGFELIQFEKWFKEKILSFNKTSKLNRRR